MRRAFKTTGAVLILLASCFLVDRVSLVTWRWRVECFYTELRKSAEDLQRNDKSEARIIGWSGNRNRWQVPFLQVILEGPRPAAITVDGNGGLNLLYKPPWLAWSRYIPYLFSRQILQGSDVYPYNDVYEIRVRTIEGKIGGMDLPYPHVELEHGLPP